MLNKFRFFLTNTVPGNFDIWHSVNFFFFFAELDMKMFCISNVTKGLN